MSEEHMTVDEGGGRQSTVKVNYPSNSKRSKETGPEKEKVEKIVTGEVKRQKSSPGSKFFHQFFSEDAGTLSDFLIIDVLIPAAKNMLADTGGMIADAIRQGVERKLFGDARPRSRPSYTNYSKPVVTTGRVFPGERDPRPTMSRQAKATHDFNDVVLATRVEAEDVLDRMRDLINSYQVATVADFYDLVGLTGEFTDNKWGWYDLRSAAVRSVRGGYLLHLPRTEPIV